MIKSYKGVLVDYKEFIPTSKQMAEFYVWQEGCESYATITYLDRTVEVERNGEMSLTFPAVVNGELQDDDCYIACFSDDLEEMGIHDDIQLTQFIKTISNSGYQIYRMNPWWEIFIHDDEGVMGEGYDSFYEAVDGGIEYIIDDENWK